MPGWPSKLPGHMNFLFQRLSRAGFFSTVRETSSETH